MNKAFRKIRNFSRHAIQHLLNGDIAGWGNRIFAQIRDSAISDAISISKRPADQWRFGIITTQHTRFIAHLIKERIHAHGWHAEILTAPPFYFSHDWYVVICPQMFSRMPPGKKRIAFQMEQSVSSRWFSKHYLSVLRKSFAVLEYSLINIEYLASKQIAFPHVHYLPIGASLTYGSSIHTEAKNCDVLFYGDHTSSPRRRQMLDTLKQHFNVRTISEIFGPEMQKTIMQSRLVINLHYYDDGLLEMPRIQECLSLGIPVVSESSKDQDDYPELAGSVSFFEQGSIPAMLKAVKDALKNPVPNERLLSSTSLSAQRFAFMFDRFLIAQGFLPSAHAIKTNLPLPESASNIALSLPETIERRRIFNSAAPAGYAVFDGMRRRPGWIGCGLSYLALAHHALTHKKNRLSVMEDDVVLPDDYESKIAVVHEFLDTQSGQWDVFSGVIAALHPETRVLSVVTYKNVVFVTINKMTSMVFNIYSEKALSILATWNPENADTANTIDRFLESQDNLRVVVALPFLVGHREEVHSTLWGFSNTEYSVMIQSCELALLNKASLYREQLIS